MEAWLTVRSKFQGLEFQFQSIAIMLCQYPGARFPFFFFFCMSKISKWVKPLDKEYRLILMCFYKWTFCLFVCFKYFITLSEIASCLLTLPTKSQYKNFDNILKLSCILHIVIYSTTLITNSRSFCAAKRDWSHRFQVSYLHLWWNDTTPQTSTEIFINIFINSYYCVEQETMNRQPFTGVLSTG